MKNKKIKANEANLLKALRATAKAHNVEFVHWKEDGQVGIKTENIPTLADVKNIVSAFAINANSDRLVEVGYGYITVFLCCEYKGELSDLDELCLKMALPAAANIKWQTL